MTVAQWGFAKHGALSTLAGAIVQLKNWPEVWPHVRRHGCATEFPHASLQTWSDPSTSTGRPAMRSVLRRIPVQGLSSVHQRTLAGSDGGYRCKHRRGQPGLGYPAAARPRPCLRAPSWHFRDADEKCGSQPAPRTGDMPSTGRSPSGRVLTFHTNDQSVLTTVYKDPANKATGEFTASTVSLDDVIEGCAQDGPVGLVKIDAEGAEADILEGARPWTLKAIGQFVIEYHEALCEHSLRACTRQRRLPLHHAGNRAGVGPALCDVRDSQSLIASRACTITLDDAHAWARD